MCNEKQAWDVELSEPLQRKWKKGEQSSPERGCAAFTCQIQEPLVVELRSFGDASRQGVGATVYAVVRQPSGKTERLVAAKAQLAKQGKTIPRLQLVAEHTATNLVTNVKNALEGLPISRIYGWLDSTVALQRIQGDREYKQFVQNHVRKIQAYSDIVWQHVGTVENPPDLASQGGLVTRSNL